MKSLFCNQFVFRFALFSSNFFIQEISTAAVEASPYSRSDLVENNNNFGQVARQDYEDEDDDQYITPRIKDFADGIDGILQGISSSNANKFLAGSLAFIPSSVRGGVKGILGSIMGRPITQSATTAKSVAGKAKGNTKVKTSSKTEDTKEKDSEELVPEDDED